MSTTFSEPWTGEPFAPWTGYAIPGGRTPWACPNMALTELGGRRALRVTVRPGDYVYDGDRTAGKDRAELLWAPPFAEFGHHTEWWYKYSIFVPVDYPFEAGKWQLAGQWHEQAAPGQPHPTSSPPLSFRLLPGIIRFVRQMGEDEDRGDIPIQQGVWTDLILRVWWSVSVDGFAQIEGPGGLHHISGANLPPSGMPNMLRLGTYRGFNHTTEATVLFGPFRVAKRREDLWARR